MKNNYKKLLLSLLFVSTSFFPFVNSDVSARSASNIVKNMGNGQIDWSAKIIKVKGSGALPDTGGLPQRRLKARLAARMDAYRNIAEMINGVQVTSETTVLNMAIKSDLVKLRVDAIVKGARQSSEEKNLPDGTVEVELYLPLFGNGSIASALDLGNYVKNKTSVEAFIPYQVAALKDFTLSSNNSNFPEKISSADTGTVTGLIIDATGLGIEPAMSPFIVGGGKIIYAGGRMDIDPEAIVKYGVTDYTSSLEDAKKDILRIGNSPLIIEANGATGKPSRTNVLLDDLTLKNLKESDEKYKFLSKLGVVIVI